MSSQLCSGFKLYFLQFASYYLLYCYGFSLHALTLLVLQQEGHPAFRLVKN